MSRSNARRVNKREVQQQRQLIRKRVMRISGGVMAVVISLSALFLLNRTFQISQWEIKITGAAPENLERQLDSAMKSLPDYDFWSTRPSLLRQHLLTAVPDLETIEVQRTLTGSLKLQATARSAIGLWQREKGEIFLVDTNGNAYRLLQASETVDLPMLRINETALREASAILQSMQLNQPVYFSHISELFADSSSWKINFNRGQQWMISRNRNRPDSIRKISELLKKPRWRSGHWRVDARTAKRWFIRPTRYEGVI